MISRYIRDNILGFVAIFLALSGLAVAAGLPKNSVKSKQIKDGQVKSADVADNGLSGVDIDESSLSGIQGAVGPAGPQGLQGPPGPSTGPAGGDLSGTYPNPSLATGAVGPAETATIPAARVGRIGAGNQIIANNTPTPINFTSQRFDTADLYNIGNTTRLTAPIDGIYEITGTLAWAGNATGYRFLFFQRNNVQNIAGEMDNALTDTAVAHHQELSTLFELSAGDYVEFEVQQSSGGNLIIPASEAWSPEFSMAWVGPAD